MSTKLVFIALFVAAAAATSDFCRLFMEAATDIESNGYNIKQVISHDAVIASYKLLDHEFPHVFETAVSETGYLELPTGINNPQSAFLMAHFISLINCNDEPVACQNMKMSYDTFLVKAARSLRGHNRAYTPDMINFLNEVTETEFEFPRVLNRITTANINKVTPTGVDLLLLPGSETHEEVVADDVPCDRCLVKFVHKVRIERRRHSQPKTTAAPSEPVRPRPCPDVNYIAAMYRATRNLIAGCLAHITLMWNLFSFANLLVYVLVNGFAYIYLPTDDLDSPTLYYAISSPVHVLLIFSSLTNYSVVKSFYLILLLLFCAITLYVAVAHMILNIVQGTKGFITTMTRLGNTVSEWHSWFYSLFVSSSFYPPARDTGVRVVFNDCEDIKQKPSENHTHPVSAADRNSASLFADHLAAKLGRTAYYVQCAKADLRRNRAGCRTWYWSKDMTINQLPFNPPSDALLVLVDVDQYMDMNTFLANNEHPVLIYTFQPTAVAAVRKDYMYTFTDNIVDYRVTGGGVYTHPVWNWSNEEVTASTYFCGIPYRTTSYLVDRRFSDEDHELIMLTPIGKWYAYPPSRKSLKMTPIRRLNIKQPNGYNRLTLHHRSTPKISTGKEGLFTSAVVDVAIDNSIAIQMADGGHALTLGVIKEMLPKRSDEAVALYGYYKSIQKPTPNEIISPSEAVIRYQYKPREYQGDAKPSLVAFMSPLLHGAYAPDKTKANEKVCIEERILKVKPKEIVINAFLSEIVSEFTKQFIPDDVAHTLIPSELTEVWDNMSRPTQRQGLIRAVWKNLIKPETETFMKAEAYGNIKPPRNISTVDGKLKYEYSQVIYSVTKYLKKQPWYAFGKTPKQIATRVATVCADAEHVISSDFSKFDGRVSNLLRHLEEAVLMRLFRFEHHERVRRLHKAQYKIRGRAKFGTKYDTGYSRLSGSPETACFNSIDNAFVAFFAWKLTKTPTGADLTSNEAYSRLGIYGGDDGLTADLPLAEYKNAATQVGQETTTEIVKRGDLGVKFLARMYCPTVWNGDCDSICDIKRTLAKFHTTPHLAPGKYPEVTKLIEKLRCMEFTDNDTPIFCELIKRAHQLTNQEEFPDNSCQGLTTWDVLQKHPADEYYPSTKGAWMMDYLNKDLPGFDYKKLTRSLGDCKTIEDMLRLPICARTVQPESKTDVIVNGDLFGPSAQHIDSKSLSDAKAETKVEIKPLPALNLELMPERKHHNDYDKYEVLANFYEMSDYFNDDIPDYLAGNQREHGSDLKYSCLEYLAEDKEAAYANTSDDELLGNRYSEYYDEPPPKARKSVRYVWVPK